MIYIKKYIFLFGLLGFSQVIIKSSNPLLKILSRIYKAVFKQVDKHIFIFIQRTHF